MADVVKFKLADVPENLNEASGKGYASAGIREGRKRERAEQEARAKETALQHAGELNGLKSAHVDELNRSGKIVSRAAHRDGVLQGIVMGMALAVALAFSTWIVMREVVITNTATQRVNYPNPPALTDQYDGAVMYERNPREPGDASN